MTRRRACWWLCLPALAIAGCGDDSSSATDVPDGGEVSDDGGGRDDGTRPDDAVAGDEGTAPDDGGGGCPPPAVPCSTPLVERVRVTSISVAPASVQTYLGGWFTPYMPVILSTLPDGSAKVGWHDGAGNVHVTPLDCNDQRRGPDLTVAGSEIHGFVALADGAAVLVRRDDVMAVVRVDDAGTATFTTALVGGSSHDVEGARWIDDWPHEGRLAWSGSQFAAYHGQTGNWGASGNHQGDRLEFLDAGGTRTGGGWDWGCSHSLDVRLAWNGGSFVPVCLSDCYPGKGIYYNHRQLVRDEPSGDCSGGSNAELGGLVPDAAGFSLAFTSREGRGSADVGVVHVAADGTPGTAQFLTDTAGVDEAGAHLVGYIGSVMLAGWVAGGTPQLAVVSTGGAVVEGPAAIEAQFGAQDDFVNWPSGDAGWAYAWADTSLLRIVRVARCE